MRPQVYIGYDAREDRAYRVCVASLLARSGSFAVQPVNMRFLSDQYDRPTARKDGRLWDIISDAPMATEFSLARFYVPLLQNKGWALFCDCDFMFRAPVEKLFALCDDRYTVMVVKHEQEVVEASKMDGQVQLPYKRKNWSSLMLLNCERFTHSWPEYVNNATGLQLHQFQWCRDKDIGEIPLEWNWLVGVSEHIDNPQAVHFTLGIPDMPGYENCAYANEWRAYANAGRTAAA